MKHALRPRPSVATEHEQERPDRTPASDGSEQPACVCAARPGDARSTARCDESKSDSSPSPSPGREARREEGAALHRRALSPAAYSGRPEPPLPKRHPMFRSIRTRASHVDSQRGAMAWQASPPTRHLPYHGSGPWLALPGPMAPLARCRERPWRRNTASTPRHPAVDPLSGAPHDHDFADPVSPATTARRTPAPGRPFRPAGCDLYASIHKALRHFMTDTLLHVGRLTSPTPRTWPRRSARSRRCSTSPRSHLDHENEFMHPAIEACRPGTSERIAGEHVSTCRRSPRCATTRGNCARAAPTPSAARCSLLSPPGALRRRELRAHAGRGDGAQRSAVGALHRRRAEGAARPPAGQHSTGRDDAGAALDGAGAVAGRARRPRQGAEGSACAGGLPGGAAHRAAAPDEAGWAKLAQAHRLRARGSTSPMHPNATRRRKPANREESP
mgnify:CR=1 FL=1